MILSTLRLVIALSTGTGSAGSDSSRTDAIIVDQRGPITTLTAALRLARPGARIIVRAGTYREPTITITQRVTIIGEGGPVFDAGNDHQGFTIAADSVTIRGLVVENTGSSSIEDRAGIKVLGARGCRLEQNTLRNTFFGIYLSKVDGCLVIGNQIDGTGSDAALTGNAIHSWGSHNLTVADNDVSGHRDGIYFEFTTDSHVEHNRSASNLRYGLHFMFSHRCEYVGNAFLANGAGVAVMYSHNVSVVGNRFEDHRGSAAYGLLLKDITDSRIENNRFSGNTVGLRAEGANRVMVSGNAFLWNGWALRLMADGTADTVRANRFIGNTFDVATNSTSNSGTFTENYWDRYSGYDLDHDGFGDLPFPPVRLFSLIAQQQPPALILLRSPFADLLDIAERVLPVLTPETLIDRRPRMRIP